MMIAYCFDPAADALERRRFTRLWAALSVTLIAILFFIAVIMLVLPLAWDQLIQLSQRIPEYFAILRDQVKPIVTEFFQRINSAGISTSQDSVPLPDILGQLQTLLLEVFKRVFESGAVVVNILSLVFITPVIAFYFLLDWDRMTATLKTWLPRQHEETIVFLFKEMDKAVAGFFRGQMIVSLLLGSFYAISLSIIGLKFGLLIGIIAGILNFIPFIGSLTGLGLSLIVAIGQFWPDYPIIAAIIGVFLVGQAVEGNILQPKLVGNNVGLHPVWLMLSLVVFGYLFGFAGLIIALSLAA